MLTDRQTDRQTDRNTSHPLPRAIFLCQLAKLGVSLTVLASRNLKLVKVFWLINVSAYRPLSAFGTEEINEIVRPIGRCDI